jgi:hypothetical protein
VLAGGVGPSWSAADALTLKKLEKRINRKIMREKEIYLPVFKNSANCHLIIMFVFFSLDGYLLRFSGP